MSWLNQKKTDDLDLAGYLQLRIFRNPFVILISIIKWNVYVSGFYLHHEFFISYFPHIVNLCCLSRNGERICLKSLMKHTKTYLKSKMDTTDDKNETDCAKTKKFLYGDLNEFGI